MQDEVGVTEQCAPYQCRVRPAAGHEFADLRQVADRADGSDRESGGLLEGVRVRDVDAVLCRRTGSRSCTAPPDETSRRSMPAAASSLANAVASLTVMPPAIQSVAVMRTKTGFSAGKASRTARATRSGRRIRFCRLPP